MTADLDPRMPTSAFDAVTLEVLWRRMISAVDEAAKALRRTSFSTLVNESNDFACVLTDARGQSLAQNTESIPSFIGTLPVTVKQFIKQIGRRQHAPRRRAGHQHALDRDRPPERHHRGQADLSQRPHRRLRRLDRACPRHRRQGALGRAARGVRGGLPHPGDEAHAPRASPTRPCSSCCAPRCARPTRPRATCGRRSPALDLMERRLRRADGRVRPRRSRRVRRARSSAAARRPCARPSRALPDGTLRARASDRRPRRALHLSRSPSRSPATGSASTTRAPPRRSTAPSTAA